MSPDGSVWEFKYDRDGLRTERVYSYGGEVIVKNEYTWVDGQLTKEYRSGGMISTPITLEYYYDGEELIGFNYNGDDYYYGKTNNGEIRFIYDSNGNIVTTYHYDAWGTPISTNGTLASTVGTINPFRYKSYYYDSETRLYYLQSRYYDPQVGRFLNADAVDFLGVTGTLLSYNLFAYCENDPTNCIDLFGALVCTKGISSGIAVFGGVNFFATIIFDFKGNFGIHLGATILYGFATYGLSGAFGIYPKYKTVYDYLKATSFGFSVAGGLGISLMGDISYKRKDLREFSGIQISVLSTGLYYETAPIDGGIYIEISEYAKKLIGHLKVNTFNLRRIITILSLIKIKIKR